MKTTIIFLSLLVFIAIPANGGYSLRLKIGNAIQQCVKTLNADDATLQRFIGGKNFLEKKAFCLANCVMTRVGAMTNAQINHEAIAYEIVESFHFDRDTEIKFRRSVNKCKSVAEKSTNKCTVAGEFLFCLRNRIVDSTTIVYDRERTMPVH